MCNVNVIIYSNHPDGSKHYYTETLRKHYSIRFKTNAERGGKLGNIFVKNSTVNKSKISVIHVDFFYEEGTNGNHKPILRNIRLSNIKTVEGESIEAKYPLYLKGFEDAQIENIVIEDAVLNGVEGESVLKNIKGLTFKSVSINGEKLEDMAIDVDNEMKFTHFRS